MDRFGRRPLLLWGSLCMTIAHLIIAVLVGKFSSSWPAHRGAGWASVAFVSLPGLLRLYRAGIVNGHLSYYFTC